MALFTKLPDKGDPSDVLQVFQGFNIELLCCRYWWLKHWEFNELSFPYWRIYCNNKPGASISFNGTDYNLEPGKIVMIAPNSSFSTKLFNHNIPESGYMLEGGRVGEVKSAEELTNESNILHLFVHFNLGSPYDNVKPGIFIFEVNDHLQCKLNHIYNYLNSNYAHFNFHTVLTIHSLISDLLSEIPESEWDLLSKDFRILNTLNYIEKHLTDDLSNTLLAGRAQLATNAFNRLFTQDVGLSPQRYVKKKRIDKSCVLLHHSELSIEEVAFSCGFADRFHFSRIFKQVTGISPALYRKTFVNI